MAELDVSNIFVLPGRITPVKPVGFAVKLGENQDAGSVSLHYETTTWKLSGITLPPKVLSSIVDRLPKR
ncbi:hypothetical protein BSZ22_01440 [Bradyrhizobium canariense]|uniref:Uncharacterized protein n=1 Tax=Bradyrhizobium canariense TaxID=255045 RepID=A0A1X3G727_9BRAD|nr:hypothetical protein BSZ22_01440 [Bradyrhizobium canariense]OSI82424.1 hypothetical protein BSZ23_01640 [Bradyrhizobium canariense]OSI96841.1 hypothetical protein BSZ25_01235 [Bradyrhizobium canariense]OSI98450.1 hypothetical protein BSZ16_31700 [Bradyrhizobium canariense]OSI98881.1 hypothetical protein BSZ24_00960 [Bradyrhizobium canariense]